MGHELIGRVLVVRQHRMAQTVVENRYSAFKASHDVSKSHTMSRLALWWIDVHPPGEAFVVTTAPTTPHVEAILWRYMGNAHKKGGLPGRITLDPSGTSAMSSWRTAASRLTTTPRHSKASTHATCW
jgi:hypothetical protein